MDTPEGLWFDSTHRELWIGSQTGAKVSVLNTATNAMVREFFIDFGTVRSPGYDAGRDLLYVSYIGRPGSAGVHVYENARTLNGGIPAPTRSITGFGTSTYGLFIDAANDRLFAVNSATASVVVLDAVSTLTGDISTLSPRTISNGLVAPRGIALDTTRDILFVANDGGSVSIYANASTTDAPAGATPTISGPSTLLLTDTDGVAIDPHWDELYVETAVSGGENRVCVFAGISALVGSNDVAPARVLEGPSFGINGPGGSFLHLR